MSIFTLLLIVFSVSLSVVAQLLLKFGMSNPNVLNRMNGGLVEGFTAIMSNIHVLAGLMAYVSSAGVWLIVLSKVDVSKAYPFVGLGFIGTMLFAYWFLNEPLTVGKVVGTTLVLIGIALIAR